MSELVAAWDLQDDCKTLRTYRVSTSGAVFVERREVGSDEREATKDRLRADRTRVGYAYYGFIWVIDEAGFALWTKERRLATGTDSELRVGDQTVGWAEIQCVEVFVDPDNLGHRGVRLDLGGRSIVVAEENFSVESNPTYSTMDLDWEIHWAEFLGRDLALWLRKGFADRHGKVTNLPQLLIYDACCELADRVTEGAGETMKSLGPIEGTGEVALRFATAEGTSFVELKAFTASGKSWYGRYLELGTHAQLATFLRDVRTPAAIMQIARELKRKLVEDDYA